MADPTAQRPTLQTASAVVPVFNGSRTLARCLDSLARQGPSLTEVHVIDDASADASSQVAEDVARRDARFRCVRHPQNEGLARTLNEGIARSTGDAILIIQQDCELPSGEWVDRGLEILRRDGRVCASGSPAYPVAEMTLAERAFGLLRDTFYVPREEAEDIGFSEFKCDLVPRGAFDRVRFDTQFRVAGEDQVLSEALARDGYRIVRYRALGYTQRFGDDDSAAKQLAKETRHGKTEAGILLRTGFRITSQSAGSYSSRRRLVNRAFYVVGAVGIVGLVALLGAVGLGLAALFPVLLLVGRAGLVIARWGGFRRSPGLTVGTLLGALALMPLADLAYAAALGAGFTAYFAARRL